MKRIYDGLLTNQFKSMLKREKTYLSGMKTALVSELNHTYYAYR